MARINQELFERQLIVIQHCRMRRLSRAAIQEMLGISRATYYRRMAVTKKRQQYVQLKAKERERIYEEYYAELLRTLPSTRQ
jgi:hypothetical protein